MECKKCGKFHDDGTADYCISCLDELAAKNIKAPEDVQELTEPKCINCNSTNLDLIDWNHLLCKDCGMFQDDNLIEDLLFNRNYKPRYGCYNCKYSYHDDDNKKRLFCYNSNSYNCNNYVSIGICGLYENQTKPIADDDFPF